MNAFLFLFFSVLMIGFAFGVVALRNPVSSAMCLVVSFVGLAALFVQLNAYFIGIIQILVYAGAVMVLFLFIIMLLDLKAERARAPNFAGLAGGVALVVLLVIQLIFVLGGYPDGSKSMPPLSPAEAAAARSEAGSEGRLTERLAEGDHPDTALVGETLFTHYTFHLQIVGILLLVATVGVILLSKRKLT